MENHTGNAYAIVGSVGAADFKQTREAHEIVSDVLQTSHAYTIGGGSPLTAVRAERTTRTAHQTPK